MKKIMKRMGSLLLALVLVAGMMPRMATEAHAATLSGTAYTTDPGGGYTMVAWGHCSTCDKKIYLNSSIEGHSFTIENFSYTITDTGFTATMTCTVKGCKEIANWTEEYDSTFENSLFKESDCTKGVYAFCMDGDVGSELTSTVEVKGSPTPHSGNATCVTSGTCTVCGKTYNASHDYDTEKWSVDKNTKKHYHACKTSGCTSRSDEADCTYSDATCTTPATCTTCGETTGEVNANAHTWGDWTKVDETTHSRTCTLDSTHSESGEHTTVDGTAATCLAPAKCGTCGLEYGTKLDHNYIYAVKGETITETCYNGCGHDLTATLQLKSGMSLDYTGYAVEPCEIAYPEGWVGEQVQPTSAHYKDNVNVGTATCTVPYGDGSVTCSFDVQACSLYDIDFNMARNFTYDGTPKKPAVTVGLKNSDITLVEGKDYTLTYVQFKDWKDGRPYIYIENSAFTEAGNYAVFIKDGPSDILSTSDDSQSVYQTYTIGKAQPTVTAPTAKKLTYTGEAQELITAGSAQVGTMVYSLDGTIYTEPIPTGTAAGDYTVWYRAVVDPYNTNYTSSTPASVEVKIGKARSIYNSPTPIQGLKYDGTAQNLINAGTSDHGTFRYALVEDPTAEVAEGAWKNDIPTATNAGTYYVKYQLVGDANHTNSEILATKITIAKIDPTYTAPAAKTGLVYNGSQQNLVDAGSNTTPGSFSYKLDGEDINSSLPQGKDAGDYTITWTFTPTNTTNYNAITDTQPIKVTVAPLTLNEDLAATCAPITWDGTEKTATLSEVKMNRLDVTYTLSDNKATDVGAYKMKLTGKDNFQGEVELEFYIMPDEDILEGITEGTVTSDDMDTIAKAKEMVANADTSGFPAEQKAALDDKLEAIEEKAEKLEAQLDKAFDATSTDKVQKGLDITADKAKVSDKKALEDAKADLEAALNTYATNYTTDQQDDIEEEIARINGILADINNADVADVIEDIEDLPKSVEPDDEKSEDRIDAAQEAYDKLTASQKKIVDNSTSGKLAKLQAELLDIDVVSISHTKWYRTSKKDLTIKFNGPYNKFDYLLFNDKELDPKHYTAKEGSTIITLKSSFLDTLTTRKENTVVAVYEIDGKEVKSEAANFTAYKYASNAATGDLFNPMLWAGIGGFSILALAVLLYLMKKRK